MKKYLIIIILIAILFRTVNLEFIPHWDWDEGENLNIAWNLANGRMQDFAISYPFVPHPPLYFMILALSLKLFGNLLIVERFLTVLFSLITVVFVYLIGKEAYSEKLGLIASFLYAIHPTAIYFSRFGFSNNLVALLNIVALYFLILYLKNLRILYILLSGFFVGLITITEYSGLFTLMGFGFVLLMYDRKRLWVLVIPTVIFGGYVTSMLLLMKDAFIHDLMYTILGGTKTSTSLTLKDQGVRIFGLIYILTIYYFRKHIRGIFKTIVNSVISDAPVFYFFISVIIFVPPSDGWFFTYPDYFWLGIIGIFLFNNDTIKRVVSIFFTASFMYIIVNNRMDHMPIPLYPFFALGLSVLITRTYETTKEYLDRLLKTKLDIKKISLISFIVVFYPIAITFYWDISLFFLGKNLLTEPISDNIQVTKYVNDNSNENDVIITYSFLSHILKAKNVILLQSVAYDGKSISYYPADLPKERFFFNASYRNSKFIILSNGTVGWIKNETSTKDIVSDIENWPRIDIGRLALYKNPNID